MMHDLFLRCFNALLLASAQAVVVAMAAGAVHLLLGPRLTPRWRTILWMLVIARLVMPIAPSSRFSLFNLGHRSSPAMIATEANAQTVVTFGIIDDSRDTTPVAHSVPPISRTSDSPRSFDWLNVAVIGWAIGFVWLMSRTVISQLRFSRRVRLLKPSHNDRLTALLASSQQKLSVNAVGLLETDLVSSPALFGAIHPTLLIPTNFAAQFSDSEIQSVFDHELAHARRRDLLKDWLLAIVVFIHWFNPAAWLTWQRLRAERELACDEAVLRDSSATDRIQYGQTILRIFEELSAPRHTVWSAGILESGGSLRQRLTQIVQPSLPSRWRSMLGLLCATIIGCATMTSPKHLPTASNSAINAKPGNDIVLREYDIRDILIEIPDFNDAPDFNAAPPNTPTTRRTREQVRDELFTRIQTEIDPASWQTRGGTGTLREDGGKMIVVQSQANQEAIWNLIKPIIARRAIQVTLETRFLREPDGFIDDWAGETSGQWIKQDGFDMWSATLNDAQRSELIRATQRAPMSSTITAPRITLFDGQRAYVIVETSRAYVKDIHEIRSSTQPGVVSYDPEIGTARSGVIVDARVQVSEDHQSVTAKLHPQLSNLISLESSPWRDAGGKEKGTIQIPHMLEMSVDTTQKIPDKQTILMRLRRVEHPTPTTHPATEQTVYLLISAHVIVQTELKQLLSASAPSSTPAK